MHLDIDSTSLWRDEHCFVQPKDLPLVRGGERLKEKLKKKKAEIFYRCSIELRRGECEGFSI